MRVDGIGQTGKYSEELKETSCKVGILKNHMQVGSNICDLKQEIKARVACSQLMHTGESHELSKVPPLTLPGVLSLTP